MEKDKFMKKIMILLAVLFVYNYMPAQVTIGMLENPQGGALLDLKESNDVGINTPNSTKGLLFPKVSLVSSTSLEPLFEETDEPQTISSLGMIVYNVNEEADGIAVGLCVWNGEEWTSIEGGGSAGAAKFDVNCGEALTIKGKLLKDKSLNPINNTLEMPVDVQKTGRYSILASTKNGYYFSSSGEFLQKGQYHVVLSGMGSPNEATETGVRLDTLAFFINGIPVDLETCLGGPQTMVVEGIEPNYRIIQPFDISAASMRMGQAGTGYMTVWVQIPPESAGATYQIQTNIQDGIQFEGSGILSSSTMQQLTLLCNGAIPTKMGTLNFQITSNSTDSRNDNIMVDVPVKGRTINVTIMNEIGGDWDLSLTSNSRGGVKRLLENTALFGPDSKYCPVEGIVVTSTNSTTPSLTNVDILIISYNIIPNAAAVTTFINNGGAVIHGCHTNSANHLEIINSILGPGITRSDLTGAPNQYRVLLTGIAQDSIVNNGGYISELENGGYISDLRGKNFGYDGGDNSYFNNVPLANADILATTLTGSYPTILKSKTKTYLVFGDGAPFMGGLKAFTDGSDTFRPLMITADHFPAVKNYGANHQNVYNAHLFVNAMIWAINRRLAVAP